VLTTVHDRKVRGRRDGKTWSGEKERAKRGVSLLFRNEKGEKL